MKKEMGKPSVGISLLALFTIIASIIIAFKMKMGSAPPIFIGAMLSIIVSLIFTKDWKKTEKEINKSLSDSLIAVLIIIFVGMLVAIWIASGTLPSLIYYGLKFMSPTIILPITFLLCAITSVFTGTSFGSVATMGLVAHSVGVNMGIPAEMIAGAVVSGSFFGDKMSPMSDTTNIAASMSGTDLYSHIGSMMYTTVPATIITTIIYTVMGIRFSATNVNIDNIKLISDALASNFSISFVATIPLFLILIFSIFKIPAILSMSSTIIISSLFGILTQPELTLGKLATVSISGYVSNTGFSVIDKILSRGGVISMTNTICVICFAAIMGGALNSSKIMEVIVEKIILKVIKGSKSLVISTMLYSYSMLLLTGSQLLALLLPAKTLQPTYEKLDVDNKVLSRTIEDTGTIGAPLIPWATSGVYVSSVLGVGMGFAFYSFLNILVPIFALICAFTGYGMWNSQGEKLWGRKTFTKKIQA